MMWWLVLILMAFAVQAVAETTDPAQIPETAEQTLVARHLIRAQTIVAAEDLDTTDTATTGALTRPDEAVGREAARTIYPGRPIRPADLRNPARVERNQKVMLTYTVGGLTITAEGRALARAGVGETVRVMNTASHGTVDALIAEDGTVAVLSR